jgi:hypothetical protein
MGTGEMLQNRVRMREGGMSFATRLLAACLRLRVPRRFRVFSSCSASFLLHLILILILAFWAIWRERSQRSHTIVVLPSTDEEEIVRLFEAPITVPATTPTPMQSFLQDSPAETTMFQAPDIPSPFADSDPGETFLDPSPAPRAVLPSELLLRTSEVGGGGFEGRTREMRARLVLQRGGTAESEDAVSRGLAWLAAHQRDDGSWRFNHHDGPCRGLCRNPGTVGSTTAATGLVLLAFLGAGEVTEESMYRDVVDKGLYYLSSRMLVTPHGGDLQEGTMYAQGIAAIALCEAYAMTGDESLGTVAQYAIDFICSAQHKEGGWRYFPGQPGDTTVFGWQIMALKSARMAGLRVPQQVVNSANAFLDRVQTENGAYYGYMKPDRVPTPTAVGLLSRMYSGRPQEDARLAMGVKYLEKLKPSRTDVYFNYYATQVMHHYEGRGWDAWNQELRDRLVATQSRRGHEHGSWYFNDEHGKSGGRLYTTAMCVMILEVYYRYMPLYGPGTLEEDL